MLGEIDHHRQALEGRSSQAAPRAASCASSRTKAHGASASCRRHRHGTRTTMRCVLTHAQLVEEEEEVKVRKSSGRLPTSGKKTSPTVGQRAFRTAGAKSTLQLQVSHTQLHGRRACPTAETRSDVGEAPFSQGKPQHTNPAKLEKPRCNDPVLRSRSAQSSQQSHLNSDNRSAT